MMKRDGCPKTFEIDAVVAFRQGLSATYSFGNFETPSNAGQHYRKYPCTDVVCVN